jgi:hypothetical protein
MSVRAAALLGFFLAVASLLHGGIYAAGHDFVVNRFTGQYQFVPADEDDESSMPAHLRLHGPCTLTFRKSGVRVARSGAERGMWRATRAGR